MKPLLSNASLVLRETGLLMIRKVKRFLWILLNSPLLVAVIPIVLAIRVVRPWLLVRFGNIISARIGHFTANTELYLCEYEAGINRPAQRHIDIFYNSRLVSNVQLTKMWKRVIHLWPTWFIAPIVRINRLVPGSAIHEVDASVQEDRDVYNLMDKTPPHLEFNEKEVLRGQTSLELMGIPQGAPYVCLTARDSAYLESQFKGLDQSGHNYRDVDVQNYVLAAEELASRGYYVLRMGAKVKEPINSRHPMVIDYATNGMRSDFMDIYLGANCTFCISCGTGFDGIPYIFRRPIAYVNMVPVGYFYTFSNRFLGIFKHHFSTKSDQNLSLREILTIGVGLSMHTSDYDSKDIMLVENTPEDIRDLVIEMHERINGIWQAHDGDELLQQKFWEIFPTEALDEFKGRPLHGAIHSRFGASFLRNNRWWLE